MSRSPHAARIHGFGTTVFSEFSALAKRTGAVNLGQGFPDFDGPDAIKAAAIDAIQRGVNQYAVGSGSDELRQAIAEHAQRFYGQAVDPATMVTVTSGATEAIADTILGLVDPGDEVVLFEPFYDSYAASVALAGGVPRFVPLHPPDVSHATWWFDDAELAHAFGPRTRLILLNTPHNPTGKVFTPQEIARIGALARAHDAYVMADEVYEHLVFAPARHTRVATVPGLAERTVTVSSGGKTFGFTGWKVGWAIAPPTLRTAVQSVHQFVTFATASPLQAAIAAALRLPDAYFTDFTAQYERKRALLLGALEDAGLPAFSPEGSYFVMADIRGTGFDDDLAFCRFLTERVGVAAIPPSAFYGPEHARQGKHFARFAFCKQDATLAEAATRLKRLKSALEAR
jgi:N-succinyldiaminopimelate aminotransferase